VSTYPIAAGCLPAVRSARFLCQGLDGPLNANRAVLPSRLLAGCTHAMPTVLLDLLDTVLDSRQEGCHCLVSFCFRVLTKGGKTNLQEILYLPLQAVVCFRRDPVGSQLLHRVESQLLHRVESCLRSGQNGRHYAQHGGQPTERPR